MDIFIPTMTYFSSKVLILLLRIISSGKMAQYTYITEKRNAWSNLGIEFPNATGDKFEKP